MSLVARLPAARFRPRPSTGRTVNQWFALTVGVLVALSAASLPASLLALDSLNNAQSRLADRLDPSAIEAQRLSTALVDQETGVRGFVLSGEDRFLQPFRRGRRETGQALARLAELAREDDIGNLRTDLVDVRVYAGGWLKTFAMPAIDAKRRAGDLPLDRSLVRSGKDRFDRVRGALDRLDAGLAEARLQARAGVRSSARTMLLLALGTGLLLFVTVLSSALVLRRVVVSPLAALADRVRAVAGGEFDCHVSGEGAREVVELGHDVDTMRERILEEVEALRVAQAELERSNAELEQFAYVASHDLQEPLRKVASFCQLLERRYKGQLDERADQYIGFAVDGAKRMQDLINDLLAFSRVGRGDHEMVDVDCEVLVHAVRANLAPAIEESGATLNVGPLPTVLGDPSLLGVVFQNLLSNALKYRGEAAPVIELDARRDGMHWVLRCSDNGIGIAPEYAERIFVLFQRLHGRSQYAGTGIGLAMCRKIVEYHGGRIWLEQDGRPGSTFCFTLPAADAHEHEPAGR